MYVVLLRMAMDDIVIEAYVTEPEAVAKVREVVAQPDQYLDEAVKHGWPDASLPCHSVAIFSTLAAGDGFIFQHEFDGEEEYGEAPEDEGFGSGDD
jgi:hypothetical protein